MAATNVDNEISIPIVVNVADVSGKNNPHRMVTNIINKNDVMAKYIGVPNNHDLSVFLIGIFLSCVWGYFIIICPDDKVIIGVGFIRSVKSGWCDIIMNVVFGMLWIV